MEAEQTNAGRVDVLGPLIKAADVRAVWEAMDTDRQRVVIDTLMTVVLLPPGRGVRFGQTVEQWERGADRITRSILIIWN